VNKTTYSEETKAAAIAALLAGQSVGQVAKEYKIPAGTVKSWKSRTLNGEAVATVATEKRQEVGELLLGYLQEGLETLRVQTIIFRDKEWLLRQDASSAAVLHGVLTDKMVRLLEAMSAGDDSDAA
jgi:transposase-like protein